MTDDIDPGHPLPPTEPMKPGARTSEFYLQILAVVVSATIASGLLPEGSDAIKIAGIIATVLGALGYTVARTIVKQRSGDGAGAIAVRELVNQHRLLASEHRRLRAMLASRAVEERSAIVGHGG